MRHFMPHPLFLFEARRASKGSVSASLRSARNVRPQDAPRPLVDVRLKLKRHSMPHPLFLFEARRASKGSVSPAGSVGAKRVPQARSALSWTLKMTGNPLKKCDFRFFYAKNDLCQLNTAFSNCCKFRFCNSFSFRTSNHSNFPTVQKIEKNADFCPICNSFATVTKK